MNDYRLETQTQADRDVDAALAWYENERPGLALVFLGELRACFARITGGPFTYQILRAGVRRARLRRFPYAVYHHSDDARVLILAVTHTRRHPDTWKARR